MENLENVRLSLDEIGDALKKISSGTKEASQSLVDFHNKVAAFFPNIQYETEAALWADKDDSDDKVKPLWWDDLDDEFELEELHWLTKIQKYELLNADEVKQTMEAIEAGIFAEAALSDQLPGFDKKKYERKEIEKIAALGNEAFDYMLVHNLKLALHISRRYSRKIGLEDAFSYAVIGTMQAIRKFDWKLGNQFSTYATWWIRQSLSREIADSGTTIRIPVHAVDRANTYQRDLRILREREYTTASEVVVRDKFGNVIKTYPALPPCKIEVEMDSTLTCALEAMAEQLEFWDVFHQAPWLLSKFETPDDFVSFSEYADISKDLSERLTTYVLSKREIEVIHYRYGYGSSEPMTLEDIGKIYFLTRERVRQIESKALKKVNDFLVDVNLQNYWDEIERATKTYLESLQHAPAAIAAKNKRRKLEQQAEKYWIKKQKQSVEKINDGQRDMSPFINANFQRTKRASEGQVTLVKWALDILKEADLPEKTLLISRARLENPAASLTELARLFDDKGITKDVVSGTIRRLIAKASRDSGITPPEV
jgi:RNA polymerase primary sigma factor